MSDCCSDDDTKEEMGEVPASDCCSDDGGVQKGESSEGKINQEKIPESIFGRFLYNIGKKDLEKNKGKSKGGGCC